MSLQSEQELVHRRGLWSKLVERGRPLNVALQVLRDLGIYGGMQGIWVETRGVVKVGGFTEGQRRYLDFHRNSVLLRAAR